ncbi:methyltransferase domain-containing protein [Gongronella butleri]|nr:methyltransferase domain-containing protein [Gongronella butleri]
MAPFVASVAKDACVQHVVDLGAGQGYLSRMLAFQHDLVVMAVDGSETQTCGAQRFDRMAARGFKEKAHQLHHVTDLLTPDTAADILASTENENQWLICGLHACGDLSSMTLRLFTQRDEIKALVNVGCCYHFLTHPGDGDGDVGFPMSRLVQGYSLGSRACMLACQAPSRWLDQREATIISFQHHFYRFLLHWVMVQRGLWDVQVKAPTIGRLNKKRDFKSFPVYVRAALTRLGMDPDAISDVDAQTYHDTFKQTHQTDKRIALCWTIRALLGPAVESLILMDRYAYLDETLPATSTKKVWLCPLFDPVVSPRNMVVMATK